MKKSYKLLVVALIATVGFASCGKDGDTEKNSSENAGAALGVKVGDKTFLVSKIIESSGEYEGLEYDEKGRLTKYSYFENGRVEEYYSLIYSGDKVTVTNIENGVEDGKIVYTIGANGFASQSLHTEVYRDGAFTYNYKSTADYTYDGAGYLTKMVETEVETSNDPARPSDTETATTNFTYTNGNLTRIVETYDNGTYTVNHEYDTDRAYNPALDIEDLMFLTGKPSKNLLKKVSSIDVYNGQTYTDEQTYTYAFNANGLPNVIKSAGRDDRTIEYVVK